MTARLTPEAADPPAHEPRLPSDGVAPTRSMAAGKGKAPRPIQLELSRAQVAQIVRSASEGDSLFALFGAMHGSHNAMASAYKRMALADSKVSATLVTGLFVLAAFPADGGLMGNAEIAKALEMNPSTAHRYISTLVFAGLLHKNPDSRKYGRLRPHQLQTIATRQTSTPGR